jgi:hypothetical protein
VHVDPEQQGPPMTPHAPPLHPPPEHIPCPGHADPEPTHDPATQHPPPLHTWPSQHACPLPPHVTHCPLRPHVWPEAVQKSAERPPPGAPTQHGCPEAPHVPQLSVMLQVPSAPPQLVPLLTHVAPTQQ